MKHRFVFFNPGHFHAALILRAASRRVDADIHVYAQAGPELDAFAALIKSFNSRANSPTAWRLHYHDADLNRLIEEQPGSVAVLAGINHSKLANTEKLANSGIHVLADKPWLTRVNQLPSLSRALNASVGVMDIMTIRHEILSRLCHEVARTKSVFGEYSPSSRDEPAVEVGSIHHLYKRVNNEPLRRPVWYYDAEQQGDGLVDIQSHMVEQAFWFLVDDLSVSIDQVELIGARRWATHVPLSLFERSTGARAFPSALTPYVDNSATLHYPCNGEINWTLDGVHVQQTACWRPEEPAGSGDLHHVRLRGTGATVTVQQGEHTEFKAQVYLNPGSESATDDASSDLTARVEQQLAQWQVRFPGLTITDTTHGLRLDAPASLDDGHESHFPLVRDRFLDFIEGDGVPDSVRARIATRYQLIAKARQFALTEDQA